MRQARFKRSRPRICCSRRQTPRLGPVLVAVVSKQSAANLSWRFHSLMTFIFVVAVGSALSSVTGAASILQIPSPETKIKKRSTTFQFVSAAINFLSQSTVRGTVGEKDSLISTAFVSRCIFRCRCIVPALRRLSSSMFDPRPEAKWTSTAIAPRLLIWLRSRAAVTFVLITTALIS